MMDRKTSYYQDILYRHQAAMLSEGVDIDEYAPGTEITLYGVSFSKDNIHNRLHAVYDNKVDAQTEAAKPLGWYGGTGSVRRVSFVLSLNGWGEWVEIESHGMSKKAIMKVALSKLTDEEISALGL